MFRALRENDKLSVYNGQYCFGISLGNMKLSSKKFAILNFTPAFLCKGDSLGKCQVSDVCYAKNAENTWPSVMKFRFNNFNYFQHHNVDVILRGFRVACRWLQKHNRKILRLQESGDFISQWWVDLAGEMANIAAECGIKTYTYTTRDDLKYDAWPNLMVRGSGWHGPYGKNIVINKKEVIPEGYKLCKMSCGKCGLCYNGKSHNIAFIKHGTYKEKEKYVHTR